MVVLNGARRQSGQSGSVTLEYVLTIPVLMLTFLIALQILGYVATKARLAAVSFEVARAVALVEDDPGGKAQAVLDHEWGEASGTARPSLSGVSVGRGASRVEVSYPAVAPIVFLGRYWPPLRAVGLADF